jgi:acyl-CoA dehydrogenase
MQSHLPEKEERSVGQFHAVQHLLAETLVKLELAKYATSRAAWMSDTGRNSSVRTTAPKLFASEAALLATDRGMRVMAGAGFMREYRMQRSYRDVRQLMFAPVTNEMCKNFIGQVGCGLPKS